LVQREFGRMNRRVPPKATARRTRMRPSILKPSVTSNRCISASASRRFRWGTKTASVSPCLTIFLAAACLAPLPEHSRKTGPRLRCLQRADALFRRRNDDRLRRHRCGDDRPGHRSHHPGISRPEGITCHGRRASPLEESPQRLADALARVHSSRMSNLARQELYFGRFYSLDEISPGSKPSPAKNSSPSLSDIFRPD